MKQINESKFKDSFEEIYQKYFDQVYTYFYRRTYNVSNAIELTQDTFLRVYINMKSFDYNCPINYWIFKIAHNLYCSELKRSKIQIKAYKGYIEKGGEHRMNCTNCQENSLIKKQDFNIVLKKVIELPDMMKKCIIFRVLHELKYKEIAELLNISVNTVKTHLKVGMKKLRQRIAEEDSEGKANLNEG